MAEKVKTKKPTGLAIARNGWKFTFSWKIADKDHGAGQDLEWKTNTDKNWKVWKKNGNKIGKTAKSATVTLSASDYYPNEANGKKKPKLTSIAFRIRGERAKYHEGTGKKRKDYDPTVSDWASKTFTFAAPKNPTVSASLNQSQSNACTFSWNYSNDVKSKLMFSKVVWQSVLIKGNNAVNWNDATARQYSNSEGATGSITITEDLNRLADGNAYTRYFRARCVNVNGVPQDSKKNDVWATTSHIYATPKTPTVSSASYSNQGGGMICRVKFTSPEDGRHPVDKIEVQYKVGTPTAGLNPPSGDWDTGAEAKNTSAKNDTLVFRIEETIGLDECLWVRILMTHDKRESASDPYRVPPLGKLEDPEIQSVTTEDSTFLATIVADNNSDVPGSRLAVIYRKGSDAKNDIVVGYSAAGKGEQTITVQCPDWSEETAKSFGVFAYYGSQKSDARADGVSSYTITKTMSSNTVWQGGSVPMAPTNTGAVMSSDASGEVVVTWDWSWRSADAAEISWSQNENAWESTDEPDTYMVTSLVAGRWRVSGLETGVRWYFRVRLAKRTGDDYNYGPYCEPMAVDLSSAPAVPVLTLSEPVITVGGSVTASWVYATTDGTGQAYASICEATIDSSGITYGEEIAHATSEQSVTIPAGTWEAGTMHYLCVRVTSASGHVSDGWSAPVSVMVAEPLTCTLVSQSITTITITDDDGTTRDEPSLTALPILATVTGAGTTGLTRLIIERAADYHMERPDGSEIDGFEGETIVLHTQDGEDQISIDTGSPELIGALDDGAQYRMIATIEDAYGQTAQSDPITFEVHWRHQAGTPTATVTNGEDGIAVIVPTAPVEYENGDYCDIYRLSIDLPELIVQGGTFGTTYIDPYPAIGETAGYRVVHRTVNGDYITADNHPAWVDVMKAEDGTENEYSIVLDFDGNHLVLPYDISLSNKWAKDFVRTTYLGGSQQGDWNPGVSRDATYTTMLIADEDAELIAGMRELADYAGICHVRTPEGSSFAADVQVSEKKSVEDWETVSYTLSVSRIDPQELDGMTLEEYENEDRD